MKKILIIGAIILALVVISKISFGKSTPPKPAPYPPYPDPNHNTPQNSALPPGASPAIINIYGAWMAANDHGVDDKGQHEWTEHADIPGGKVWRGADSETNFRQNATNLLNNGVKLPPVNTTLNPSTSSSTSFWNKAADFIRDAVKVAAKVV